MKNLIHKTYKKNQYSIIEEGFKIPKDYPGRFGYGVYFMTNNDFGEFGDGLSIICNIDKKYILNMTHDQVRDIFPYIDYQDGGEPKLEQYVKDKGYKGVSVSYLDGGVEVVVYDTSIIKIQHFIV